MKDFDLLGHKQNSYDFGVSYLCTFLDRAGFTVLEWNTIPDFHYQILAKTHNKSFMIAVRTACHPDAGSIESSTLETLVKESEKRGSIPHFARIYVFPLATNDIKMNGTAEHWEYKVIFNGISAVHTSELHAVLA